MLIAEIISVGTELLFGEILDSNAAFLARELGQRGVTLHRKSVLGDNLARLSQAISLALTRADIVILGGGLGPTDDDLTREAIADALKETPSEDPELLTWLEGLYTSRGRVMPQINRKQAWLIPSATALANPIGTAPGWFVQTGGKIIIALPGPPIEMQKMWHEQVLPRLPLPSQALVSTTIHTQGIGESNLAELLGDLTKTANPSVATYARKMGVDVRVAASASTPEEANTLANPVLEQVRELLKRWTWGEDDDTLTGVLNNALAGRSLGIIEVGSAGMLSTLLADEPTFLDAAITQDHARLITLGLTPVTLRDCGLISKQAAQELAMGACEHLGAQVGLAVITSVAGKQAGQYYAAIYSEGVSETLELNWPGTPTQIRERSATAALALAYRTLCPQSELNTTSSTAKGGT